MTKDEMLARIQEVVPEAYEIRMDPFVFRGGTDFMALARFQGQEATALCHEDGLDPDSAEVADRLALELRGMANARFA